MILILKQLLKIIFKFDKVLLDVCNKESPNYSKRFTRMDDVLIGSIRNKTQLGMNIKSLKLKTTKFRY
jgi:hypothetical protein